MMYVILYLALLVLTYALTLASFAWEDLVAGVIFGATLLWIYRRQVLPRRLPEAGFVAHLLINFPRLVFMILRDVLWGTWLVVSIVIGLRPLSHPGVLKIPVGTHSPVGVAVVSFIVTLSPGSFLMSIDWDERVMLIHYIDISDPDQLRADLERYYVLWEYDGNQPADPGLEGRAPHA